MLSGGTLAALALATLVSEDLACVAAGVLIARGEIPAAAGVMACAIGIFGGDCALWALGRFSGRLAGMLHLVPGAGSGRLNAAAAAAASHWLERHAGFVILGSRFTPGTRLPLYVSAGLLRMPFRRFALWTGCAVVLWTPAVVLASAHAGAAGAASDRGVEWIVAGALGAVVALTRALRLAGDPGRRRRLNATLDRWRRWEFWPPWLFYLPVAAWVAVLALRHRGIGTLTASNPGIPAGGLVGESKTAILASLPPLFTIPGRRIEEGTATCMAAAVRAEMSTAGWEFPVVLKPDVGQRGTGVRKLRSQDELLAYLSQPAGAVLLQPFHEGPFEAGIFYYRFPGAPAGRILSITDKQFPVVVGNGTSTLRQLIDGHLRYRLQARLFHARHAARIERVVPAGERVRLAMAGNHAQGTTFLDGWHLWTPALEARMDTIAQSIPGFFIGRFDVRYRDREAFMAGEDLAIVELNGAGAESTNIYDPDGTLVDAYRVLFQQWSLVFRIGAENRRRGVVPMSFWRLAALIVGHLTSPQPNRLAD